MNIGVGEFLEKTSKLRKKAEKVAALKFNDSYAIRTVLQGVFDPRITWLLPEGEPPYAPNTLPDQQNVFLNQCRKLAYFVEGGAPNLKQSKRELLFTELLESIHPADAKMLVAVKDKKLPWPGITEDVVREAFPDLLP